MDHLDFDADRREAVNKPLTFSLGGETFTTVARVPAGYYLGMFADGGAVLNMHQFMRSVLIDDDVDRFEKMLLRKDDPISDDTFIMVTTRLMEALSGRPTSAPSPSAGGSSTTGDGSTAHADLPGSTPGTSPSTA